MIDPVTAQFSKPLEDQHEPNCGFWQAADEAFCTCGLRWRLVIRGLLTPRELRLLDEINAVHTGFLDIAKEAQAADRAPAYDGDGPEVCWHIHTLQNWVLAQAAARAFPDQFRLFGCDHKAPVAAQESAAPAE